VAEATVWTFVEACSDAAATAVDRREVSLAVADIDAAADCNFAAAVETVTTITCALASNSFTRASTRTLCASRTFIAYASLGARSLAAIMLSLGTCTAFRKRR
jgi:hypothetical protein